MYRVYWSGVYDEACHRDFTDMTAALNWMQELRDIHKRQFVCMSAQVPGNVTKMGVADVGADYCWKKRRS
jgi:hypothetical protein